MRTVPSASQHDFAKAPQAEIPRSKFDRSHNYKTTFDSGYLIPFFGILLGRQIRLTFI